MFLFFCRVFVRRAGLIKAYIRLTLYCCYTFSRPSTSDWLGKKNEREERSCEFLPPTNDPPFSFYYVIFPPSPCPAALRDCWKRQTTGWSWFDSFLEISKWFYSRMDGWMKVVFNRLWRRAPCVIKETVEGNVLGPCCSVCWWSVRNGGEEERRNGVMMPSSFLFSSSFKLSLVQKKKKSPGRFISACGLSSPAWFWCRLICHSHATWQSRDPMIPCRDHASGREGSLTQQMALLSFSSSPSSSFT